MKRIKSIGLIFILALACVFAVGCGDKTPTEADISDIEEYALSSDIVVSNVREMDSNYLCAIYESDVNKDKGYSCVYFEKKDNKERTNLCVRVYPKNEKIAGEYKTLQKAVKKGKKEKDVEYKALHTDAGTFYYMNKKSEKPYFKGCAELDKGYVIVYMFKTEVGTKHFLELNDSEINLAEKFIKNLKIQEK